MAQIVIQQDKIDSLLAIVLKTAKTIFMVIFTFIAFFALVQLKSELGIDIFPSIDTPLDEISNSIFNP